MEHKLEYIGEHGYEERGDLYGYDTQPSSKLMVPTERCLEITLTPNKLFRYPLQFVNIILSSGIMKLENPARQEDGITQLFGFFGKDDVLKFGICLKNEEEVGNDNSLCTYYHKREEGSSAGELYIVHGGVINEEDTWEMLSNYYKIGFIEARAEWTLRPGFDTLEVYVENENHGKVKKLEAIYKEKCDTWRKSLWPNIPKLEKKEDKPKVLETNSSKKDKNENVKEKSKKVFVKKDWREENHGLKVVKLTKSVDEKPVRKPEKSAKSGKSIYKKSKKSEKSMKSQKSVPKEVFAKTFEPQNPASKSNRSEKAHTPGESQKSASSVKSSSKETVTKTEITQNTELKSSAEPEKVPKQEKKKKNPCCSIL